MRKKAPKKKANNLKDILDSDDELPSAFFLILSDTKFSSAEYIDLPFVPAYQVDDRFECTDEKKNNVHKHGKEQSEHHLRDGLRNGGTVTARGYLNKKDTFCFLCLEPNTDKKTQEWFLNFLMLKDLQANYTFLTTCLVPSWGDDNSSANKKSFKECNEKTSRYKMVACK